MPKPIIIVPYRDRQQHLSQFLNHMQIHYPSMPICIVEQYGNKPFNRGKLLNIGYLENTGYSHYIFHDVDMLPINVDYLTKIPCAVLQLARSEIQLFDYLGGVTRFGARTFRKAGGYNNEYYHRAEDNEMAFNLKRLFIPVINKFGTFKVLEHERKGPEFDPALWKKAQLKRKQRNQLECCKYGIKNEQLHGNVKHILASL